MQPTYTAVATSSGRDGREVSSDRRLDVRLAMPNELGGTGDGTNPEQLFAAGWAA
jgi:lipoyl-dependent peroxiredoxin